MHGNSNVKFMVIEYIRSKIPYVEIFSIRNQRTDHADVTRGSFKKSLGSVVFMFRIGDCRTLK